MDADNTEKVAVQDLVEGDVVLHPERHMWMRVIGIFDGPETVHRYEQGKEPTETRRLHRQLKMDPIHRLEVETPTPFYLDYRDAGVLELITRWRGGDLPSQQF
ncbi:hypothetical protein [Mycobacteroides abscessus]|uniref:hypothetical protein n=1 Tax=Mycobacteroides abscessus TaxID=36809 RepID=UPI00030C58B2|nr:hypothetical protein [Mycobacteroides abscessus]WJJ55671.1 hypothetical protein PROPHIT481_50 [Mycobacterium phage prophiT48-1]WJJ55932.1 hypothetical protein PROPHIT361_50 [Mycobacterium phage prophiT36-1]MBE5481683.1 hypothetical protein [Mycobacteroides abscessus]MDB2208841.1 hypothetical protein [Mycobacteroides abscessus subsp. massiliense]MDB2231768.1 hypothetical protein [Mycobacteroides abscessus subsp. massiliense]